uniref:Gem-associated protein 8 n=2 Tax=Castor canadensis TaxID=51338 RepID=A0A250XWT8_CASCN
MAAQASTSKATTSWYCHPMYARYWQHYYQAMAWMQRHHNAYRKAVASYYSFPWSFPPTFLPQSPDDHYMAWQGSHYSYSHFGKSGHPAHDTRRTQTSKREDQALSEEEEEMETESDEEIECDLSNMEITDELRQYFAETERHREERRRQQQLDAERLEDYINADHGLYYNTHRTVEPPSERPGERRQAEMKRLYGDSAAKIQAMEAAVQLSFNKHCDRKQPKYWPVIPLKF